MTTLSMNRGHDLPATPASIPYASPHTVKQIRSILTTPKQAAPQPQHRHHHHRHVWIITGPAGCGKSTIAQYLSKELAIPFVEGDDYHSESNKQKMSQGQPLTDQDRWDWLINLREAAAGRILPSKGSTAKAHDGVVVTCSALKRRYRDVLRIAAYNDNDIMVHFIFLRADEDVLMARVSGRKGHYMKSTMVRSQIELLEEPDMQEQGKDVLEVDCSGALAEVQKKVVKTVRQVLADDQ